MRLLIIEDEIKTMDFLRRGLTESGFAVDGETNGLDGLHRALEIDYDVIILDVMIPGIDGWEVLERLRRSKRETPVIFLTALDAFDDRIRGLELGGDDYIVKPFAFSELLIRIHNILRRRKTVSHEVLRVADLEIDLLAHRATRSGKRLDLTPKEFALLTLLVNKQGEVLTRTRIAERIWNLDRHSDTNVVDVHIRRLRAKVDDPFPQKLIQTIRGVGYVLEERD
jgi:two-component system copper resistance phosphate regulon response regulator CusR